MRIHLFAVTAGLFLSLLPVVESALASSAEPGRLRAHVEFLASDALEGRATGTRGYTIAAEYVASEFRQLGLEPAGDAQSFFQSVPLRERELVDVSVVLQTDDGPVVLERGTDFLMAPDMHRADVGVSADAVFAGYGIVAPRYDHDDYEGLDVDGKIVVMLAGRPSAWPSEEGAHLASSREKARHAAERGAVGLVVLFTPEYAETFGWEVFRESYAQSSMSWLDEQGMPDGYRPQLRGGALLNIPAAERLFASAAQTLQQIFDAHAEEAPISGFPLAAGVSMQRSSRFSELSAPNIVAAIPGSDAALRDEYLVFTAHLDHLGVIESERDSHGADAGSTEKADTIYNGALDNATGVATLLEAARVLSEERDALRRSVLFLVVAAEEKGLLGAGYFARQPTVPIEQIVANVNLDMPMILYPFADVVAFGSEHSTLKASVERAAGQAGIALSPDPAPEQAFFTRSDHYRLVQAGVPAVYLDTGYQSRDPSLDGEAITAEHLASHYHKPSDDVELPINYEAGALLADININIARDVCTRDERPQWNPGDFFGETFARQ